MENAKPIEGTTKQSEGPMVHLQGQVVRIRSSLRPADGGTVTVFSFILADADGRLTEYTSTFPKFSLIDEGDEVFLDAEVDNKGELIVKEYTITIQMVTLGKEDLMHVEGKIVRMRSFLRPVNGGTITVFSFVIDGQQTYTMKTTFWAMSLLNEGDFVSFDAELDVNDELVIKESTYKATSRYKLRIWPF